MSSNRNKSYLGILNLILYLLNSKIGFNDFCWVLCVYMIRHSCRFSDSDNACYFILYVYVQYWLTLVGIDWILDHVTYKGKGTWAKFLANMDSSKIFLSLYSLFSSLVHCGSHFATILWFLKMKLDIFGQYWWL